MRPNPQLILFVILGVVIGAFLYIYHSAIPLNPYSLVGDWHGIYKNVTVGTGSIDATFYMDGSAPMVMFDLQNGEYRGQSDVQLAGHEIRFGVSDKNKRRCMVNAEVNLLNTTITGTLTFDYVLDGTRTGPVTLYKK
jgi:hypothetical protein